jgi:hypothetical protein
MEGKLESTTGALVLADVPERVRLRELLARIAEVRDSIAELQLEIEGVRERLALFESAYNSKLAAEHSLLRRIELLVQHFDRWVELLGEASRPRVVQAKKRVEERRARDLREQAPQAEPDDAVDDEDLLASAPKRNESLKQAYRALARKFHPDLARTEEERLRFGDLMARINQLYQAGDVDQLLALAEQAKGGELDDVKLDVASQIEMLEERLRRFDSVLGNLRDERVALERSPTCELLRNVEQAAASGRDLTVEIREELRERIEASYAEIAKAAHRLEREVTRYNRAGAHTTAVEKKTRGERALVYKFDPYADKRLVRLGLDELKTLNVSREARAEARRLADLAETDPALVRLLFFTYVAELSPFPLPGLETYEDVKARFEAVSSTDERPTAFEKVLVLGDAVVEFGVRHATEKVAHMGLRFRSQAAREAMPVLLQSLTLRREFKKILGVLGDRESCTACQKQVFAVPLFKTRGLDDLRALVCPSCGAILRSYWMPKGKDVQAVLNPAFLDFELVTEWAFKISRGSIAMQLLPLQVDDMTVADLRRRLHDDVFRRYDIPVTEAQLRLVRGKKPLPPKTRLASLETQSFRVQFASDAEVKEADALEMLRHRIRNRFKAD